jgi:hypothetical protein
MFAKAIARASLVTLALAVGSTASLGATIDWLNMAPPAFGSVIPNSSVYNLPGVGPVTVTYSIPAGFTQARVQNPLLTAGNVGAYAWTDYELFAATNTVAVDPIVPVPWRVTFGFTNTIPAGQIFVGVAGLGQTTSYGGGATTATVSQNGSFLGDWSGGGNYGPTLYTGGAGTFTMQNSLTGAGGADPWWNSQLGVVRIMDPVSSITVDFAMIAGDGAGVNIGYVPAPGAVSLIGVAGMLAVRRRRR